MITACIVVIKTISFFVCLYTNASFDCFAILITLCFHFHYWQVKSSIWLSPRQTLLYWHLQILPSLAKQAASMLKTLSYTLTVSTAVTILMFTFGTRSVMLSHMNSLMYCLLIMEQCLPVLEDYLETVQ